MSPVKSCDSENTGVPLELLFSPKVFSIMFMLGPHTDRNSQEHGLEQTEGGSGINEANI